MKSNWYSLNEKKNINFWTAHTIFGKQKLVRTLIFSNQIRKSRAKWSWKLWINLQKRSLAKKTLGKWRSVKITGVCLFTRERVRLLGVSKSRLLLILCVRVTYFSLQVQCVCVPYFRRVFIFPSRLSDVLFACLAGCVPSSVFHLSLPLSSFLVPSFPSPSYQCRFQHSHFQSQFLFPIPSFPLNIYSSSSPALSLSLVLQKPLSAFAYMQIFPQRIKIVTDKKWKKKMMRSVEWGINLGVLQMGKTMFKNYTTKLD